MLPHTIVYVVLSIMDYNFSTISVISESQMTSDYLFCFFLINENAD